MSTIARLGRCLVLLSSSMLACSDPPPPNCSSCSDAAADGGSVDDDAGARSDVPSLDADLPDVATPDGGEAGGFDAQAYVLTGRFDWPTRRLHASERVTLRRTSAGRFAELDAAVDVKKITSVAGDDLPFVLLPNLLRIDVSTLMGDEISFNIEYEASTSSALVASSGRDDDPVTARVVYTDSEPTDGMRWLPAIHKPADRAGFSVELTVLANEDVIANGARTKDEMRGGERLVRYDMTSAIPTYTMAFAAGEIEHRSRVTTVPIDVWYRRGLVLDTEAMLDFLSSAMRTYDRLLGDYPWPRYAVVLLPEFSGGMENTTITFTSESAGQANLGANLQAHELAHHWFGDWVTVATFDDVWIKEGMATLLAPEAERGRQDAEDKGRRFGNNFGFNPADSIRDKSLVGIAKYTSGPYQRAAWLLTQIRERLGEAAFWQSVQGVLRQHERGSIDSETFVRSFGLDEPTVQKVLRLLDEKRAPSVSIVTHPDPAGTLVQLNLSDPGGTMIAPTIVTVVDASGQATTHTLVPEVPLGFTVPTGGYVAPDENDVHPEWSSSFTTNPDEYARFAALLLPSSSAARTAFSSRTAAHQERALDASFGYLGKIDISASDFQVFYGGLDSYWARRSAEIAACYAARNPADRDAWTNVLEPVLQSPAMTTWSPLYAHCGTDFATRIFGAEFARVAVSIDAKSANRFVYLSSFDYGATATFDALSPVAVGAPTLQLREQALNRMSYQTLGTSYSPITTAEERARWQDFFRARLVETKSPARFTVVWRGVVGLRDDRALVTAGEKLHTVALSENVQRNVACDAYMIANSTRPDAWNEFQRAAEPWDTLGAAARAVLSSGGVACGP